MSSREAILKHGKRIVFGAIALGLLAVLAMAVQAGIEFGRAHQEIVRPASIVPLVLALAYTVGWMIDDQRKVSEL